MVRLTNKPVSGDWAKNVLALQGAYADVVCENMFSTGSFVQLVY